MVVCAENVDSLVKVTCYQLVIVISDVRNYICVKTVASLENEVLVETVFGSLEPYSTVLLISLSCF